MGVSALFLAFLCVLGYFSLSYQNLAGRMETEARHAARNISRIVNINPEMWMFEQARILFYMEETIPSREGSVRVLDIRGTLVAEYGRPPSNPLIVRRSELYDAGILVGNVELRESLRPLLIRALLLAFAVFPLFFGLYFLLYRVFMRELSQAEQTLRESEKKYRTLVNEANDVIVIVDSKGFLRDINRKTEEITGYSRDELLNQSAAKLFRKEIMRDAFRLFRKGFTRKGVVQGETDIIRKDARRVPLEISAASVELAGTRYLQVIARDITERRRLEEERIRADRFRSLGVIAGGIAHDFNNILTSFFGYVSLVKTEMKPESQGYSRLGKAERALRRARQLTGQLLTFSKGGEPIKAETDLGPVIREAADLSLIGKGTESHITISDDLWAAEVDELQFSQVINNLVINAGQAMDEGGTVRVHARNVRVGPDDPLPLPEGPYIAIGIEDDGVGIPEQNLKKIFDPYYSTKEKGSGLGLATCYSIVDRHGGTISVESEEGKGATFTIYLPALGRKVSTAGKFHPDTDVIGTGGGKVLLMDDEEVIRDVAEELLVSLGYEVTTVPDGEAALEEWKKSAKSGSSFDLVILDLTVPGGLGGLETVKIFREMDSNIKVMVSSGYSEDEVFSNCERYGFWGAIAKPYSLDELGKALYRVRMMQGLDGV